MELQLTERQAEILGILQEYVAENGRPPSRPELAKMLGIASTNGVFKHLEALARKGAVLRPVVPPKKRPCARLGAPLRQLSCAAIIRRSSLMETGFTRTSTHPASRQRLRVAG